MRSFNRLRARMTPAAVALLALTALVLGPTPVSAAAAACPGTQSDIDVNGDGYDDAVVGDPYASVNGQAQAGAIVVLYGDADCRIGQGARRLVTQATAGVPGTAEAGDHFGWSVAVDDLSGDGRADIVVGTPGEDVGPLTDAGSLHVISFAAGSATSSISAVSFIQNQLGSPAEAGDQLGYSVAAADAGGDEAGSRAAAGAPGEDVGGAVDAGVVDTFGFDGAWQRGGEFHQGLTGAPSFLALPGTPESGDRFGANLLIAQLNAPFTGDVLAGPEWTYVIGAPGDTVAGHPGAGSVSLAYTQTWAHEQVSQDSPGVPDAAESGDGFGASLAIDETRGWVGRGASTTDVGTEQRDLAVGAPGEDVGSAADAGSVTLFRSQLDGLHAQTALTQDTLGFAGRPETGDRFGSSVAMRPAVTGQDPLLVIGVPSEDIGTVSDAGLVQTATVSDHEVTAQRSYSESSPGTPGSVGSGHRFGLTVAAMQGRAETLFAISSPYAGAGSVFLVDQQGQERSWVPGVDGVPKPAGAGRFGWSVAGLESTY